MNRLSTAERARIVACLVEGNSIRSTVRMTGAAKNTVVKLLVDLGSACQTFHDQTVRGLKSERLQFDEIWSFVAMKKKNIPAERKGEPGIGDVWTWTCIDADSKMMVSWLVGSRENESAREIMLDVSGRIVSPRIQITSDGYRHYKGAVVEMFGDSVDFATIEKVYGAEDRTGSARYSPLICTGCKRTHVKGNPDPEHISTSYVERANLTMRMGMRRFTRLTNGFSKKVDNHAAAIALHFVHYNFCRVHQTLKTIPAVKAGIFDRVLTIAELVEILDGISN
jgi:IS1 family transposase